MLVAVDVGNTWVSVGVFEGERLRSAFALASDVRRTAEEYAVLLAGLFDQEGMPLDRVDGAALSSVVPPLTHAFEQLCVRLFRARPLTVGAGTRTGIRIATRNPLEVGADRVINAVAAHRLYGGPAIVVDFTTATTFDIVGHDGAYVGSVIAPGLALSAEALFEHTSRLPRVDLSRPAAAVGRDTASALQSGLIFGHAAMVEGMLVRIQAEIGQRGTVIATGEMAALVAAEVPGISHVEPHLTLIGLRLLHELNHQTGR
ncbi:MAG: type III pantothenate kinase [Chloroflexi bacterium]|nr:type III pantothenate kinase [Chloroflexota bacterium]